MNIGEKIKQRRKELGLSAEEIAQKAGVRPATIYRYESGEIKNPRASVLRPISEILGMDLYDLVGWDSFVLDSVGKKQVETCPNLTPISKMPHHRVRMVGAVAAGVPILADEEYDVYVDAPEKADYALRIEGDSMEPTYLDGDVIYIREQPNVDDGRVAVVLVDDSATLKHVYHERDGLTLISDNHAYPPMRVSFADHDVIRILGVVVGYTRMYRRLS